MFAAISTLLLVSLSVVLISCYDEVAVSSVNIEIPNLNETAYEWYTGRMIAIADWMHGEFVEAYCPNNKNIVKAHAYDNKHQNDTTLAFLDGGLYDKKLTLEVRKIHNREFYYDVSMDIYCI